MRLEKPKTTLAGSRKCAFNRSKNTIIRSYSSFSLGCLIPCYYNEQNTPDDDGRDAFVSVLSRDACSPSFPFSNLFICYTSRAGAVVFLRTKRMPASTTENARISTYNRQKRLTFPGVTITGRQGSEVFMEYIKVEAFESPSK